LRKYDYEDDLPVTLILKVPVRVLNILEDKLQLTNDEISKIVVEYLEKYIEKNYKK
jgi:hypothetical protein